MRMCVQSLALLSVLRILNYAVGHICILIWYCCGCDLGFSCSSNLTPRLGNSIHSRCSLKKKKKNAALLHTKKSLLTLIQCVDDIQQNYYAHTPVLGKIWRLMKNVSLNSNPHEVVGGKNCLRCYKLSIAHLDLSQIYRVCFSWDKDIFLKFWTRVIFFQKK